MSTCPAPLYVVYTGIVGHKGHDPCFHVFIMEEGVMTFVAHCTKCQDILLVSLTNTQMKITQNLITNMRSFVKFAKTEPCALMRLFYTYLHVTTGAHIPLYPSK